MKTRHQILLSRWMLSPIEIMGILGLIILTAGGVYYSIKDALQLGETLNLSLTQTVILDQGIVNLQREVQLTHMEVIRLLGKLEEPPREVTRFDFMVIQVNNLKAEVDLPSIRYIFEDQDLKLVSDIDKHTAEISRQLGDLKSAPSDTQKTSILQLMDEELSTMEGSVKQLIDRQFATQRNAIIQTRDSLNTSQRTDFIAGGVLVLMSIVLAFAVRRGLNSRLQQALEADQIKSQLLRTVSHELRTPLAAINGYSQLLDEEVYGPISAAQKKTIQRILINTTQLQGMVNNLLDRAQIEQRKLIIKYTTFPIQDLLSTTQSALEILAKSKGVELLSEIAEDVPATITSDKLRLEQILFNLTSNALKFTDSGSVRLRIFMPDRTHWALQVIDTGIGIPADAQEHIFESFWQVDSSATRQYRGTGLGLSIVKELADLLGGTINLVSEPDKGSVFTLIFPLEPKNQ